MTWQQGHTTTDWLVASSIVLAALFIPFDGHNSAVALFIEALRSFYGSSTFALSLP